MKQPHNPRIHRSFTHNVALAFFVLTASLFVVSIKGIPVHAAESAAWVNSHVRWQNPSDGSAKPTVVALENDCTTTFNANATPKPPVADERSVVNESAYIESTWVTRAGDAPNKSNTPVQAGAAISMQINQLGFLCAIVTMNPSGFGIAADHKVTNASYPNDRGPVPDSGDAQYTPNQASRYESNSKILSVSVPAGQGTISGSAVGKVLSYVRDNGSRYWAAGPVPFTYASPATFTPGVHTVNIKVVQETIETYHAYGASGTSRCVLKSTGSSGSTTYGNYGVCIDDTETYPFTFTVAPPPVPYNLTPAVGYGITENGVGIPGNVAQVGDTVKFTYSVTNSGDASDGSTQCNIYGNSHVGAYSIPNPVENTSSGGYTAPSTGCPRVFPANSSTTLNTETITITNADINHTVCRSLWVNPQKLGGVAVGDEKCVVVAAKPYVKVFGGDTSAGNGFRKADNTCVSGAGSIDTWNLETAGGFAGAGAQYAAMALGSIQDFASAQKVGGATAPTGLSFANTGAGVTNTSTGLFGGSLSSVPCITDSYGAGPPSGATTLTSPINISSLTTGAYQASGDVTITGGNVNPGQRIVLYITGNSRVFIANKISYVGSWSTDNMPLFELVGKGSNFFVGSTVQQLDGAYIAEPNGATGGEIDDCALGFAEISLTNPAVTNPYNACNTKLTVNGLFSAAQVLLLRMPGTVSQATTTETPASNNAAEVFNYSPAMWIAQPPASAISGGSTADDTYQAITSLPPVL